MSMSEESATTPVGEATGSIRLHVGGDWAVADLEKLLSAARQIYSAGLVAHLARSTEAEAIRRQPEESEQQEVRVELEPIGFGEPGRLTVEGSSYDVAEAVSAAIHRVAPPRRSEPVIHGFSAAEGVETFRLRLLQGDSLAVAPEAQLQIDSISMASPGWVDLKGLGEPIKELGKLIERLIRLPGRVKDDKLDRKAKEQANETQAAIDEIEIARARMAAIEEFFRLQWGARFPVKS